MSYLLKEVLDNLYCQLSDELRFCLTTLDNIIIDEEVMENEKQVEFLKGFRKNVWNLIED